MTEYCPYCGSEILKTNYGNSWCSNCGKVNLDEEPTDDDHSYIG